GSGVRAITGGAASRQHHPAGRPERRGRAASRRRRLSDRSRPRARAGAGARVPARARERADQRVFARMMREAFRIGDWRRPAAIVICAAVLLALPPFFAGGFTLHLLTTGLYYTILAASWNLLAGFTGQFSLAHHAFAAIGAYTSGLLIRYY